MRRLFSNPAAWWVVAGLAAIVLLIAAVDNGVYEATSPTSLTFHVILRKLYSVVAFAVIGFLVAGARLAAGRSATVLYVGWVVAGYSAVIEVLQYFLDPPPEGLLSNAIDVACGFLGGAIAAWIARRFIKRSA